MYSRQQLWLFRRCPRCPAGKVLLLQCETRPASLDGAEGRIDLPPDHRKLRFRGLTYDKRLARPM